jgi:signal transduction histidine kinase
MNSNLFDKIGWRLSRWLVTGFVVLALSILSSPENRQFTYPLWIFILGGLLFPELTRLLPRTQAKATAISVIADAAIITILALGLDCRLVLLYAPLIIANISLTMWHVPLLLSLAAIGTNITACFLIVPHPLSWGSIVINSISFSLVGALSSALGHRMAREAILRTELKKKVETRSDRLSMLSHEIRTPLALIQASVELILDGAPGPLTEQQRTFVENVDENTRHITTLAENMLTQSKLESGLFNPVLQPIDVRDVVRRVVANMHIFTARREQTIRTYYPQVFPRVNADSALLQQALTNLAQNAIRHTSVGGQIIISVARNDLGLLISVTDDGAGMSTTHRQQLFRRFVTSGEGTGLGLVIVKKIIELHSGQVYVDTSLGRGTTFLLTLPLSLPLTEEEIASSR